MTPEASERPRFADQRREQLLDLLRATGSIVVAEAAVQFGVSDLTIRRDINALAAQGVVERVHGGAKLPRARTLFATKGSDPSPARQVFSVGLVVPQLDYYFPHVIAGARAAAAENGVRLLLRESSYSVEDDQRQIQALAAIPRLDAIIAAPYVDDPHAGTLLHWLDSLSLPVVLIDRQPTQSLHRIEWVSSDHAAGAQLAVEHLRTEGHTRLCLLVQEHSPSARPLIQGFHEAVRHLALDPGQQIVVRSRGFNASTKYAEMDQLLAQCRSGDITGLVIHNDPAAIALANHCSDSGVRIPEDLAIVAYDDEMAALADPPLTAVLPPKQHVGRLAVDMVLARLREGARRPPHRVAISPMLKVRASSRPATPAHEGEAPSTSN